MALVGYARVSTGGQSLEVQLRALAECNKVFQEKVSGASDDRPQLTLLLDYVKEGDVVIVEDRQASASKSTAVGAPPGPRLF